MKASSRTKARRGTAGQALARSALYRWLSLALAYPDSDALTILRDGLHEVMAAASRYLSEEMTHLEAIASELEQATPAGLREEHLSIFTHTFAADCPTYETAYGGRHVFQQVQTMSDIAGFYRAFGLDVGGSERERVDNICVELEFMHFLTYKEAYARTHHGADKARICREAQRRFLESHLGRWLPVFARKLATKTGQGFYHRVALLAGSLAAAEAELLQVQPKELEESVGLIDLTPFDSACSWETEGCLTNGV